MRYQEKCFNKTRNEQIKQILLKSQCFLSNTNLKFHPYKVEILKNAEISKFTNSNISSIVGYGLNENVGIDIIPGIGALDKLLRETVVTPKNIHK